MIERPIETIRRLFLALYPDSAQLLNQLLSQLPTTAASARPEWLYQPDNLGMSLYVDLYADNFRGLIDKIPHFKSIGVNLLHLLPIQAVPAGQNDGGYAVANYRDTNPRLGSLADFKALVQACRAERIRICIDYVINHTADSHLWAKRAIAGDSRFQAYYILVDEQTTVQAYQASLPEVFPNVAPGSFTFHASLNKWVMTTFYGNQWDLNYKNPHVFADMLDILYFYAELGISMIRLDAIPYIWKTWGTDCRNRPEAHQILSLFRLFMALKYPDVALLGEAIIYPPMIPSYFGSAAQPECHVLYHASYMVELWNSLATQNAEFLMLPQGNPSAYWIRYARCHDDIGWGLEPTKLGELGLDQQLHKEFLMSFYVGDHPASFARGEYYELDQVARDARNCGTMASLCGLEHALAAGDEQLVNLALKRIELLWALIVFRRGIPMLFQGDEWGLLNDDSYLEDSAKAGDSRWLHRLKIPWRELAADDGVHHRIYNRLCAMINLKARVISSPILAERIIESNHSAVFAVQLVMQNSSATLVANISGQAVTLSDSGIALEPYQWRLTTNREEG